jgi:hypothetical protein
MRASPLTHYKSKNNISRIPLFYNLVLTKFILIIITHKNKNERNSKKKIPRYENAVFLFKGVGHMGKYGMKKVTFNIVYLKLKGGQYLLSHVLPYYHRHDTA